MYVYPGFTDKDHSTVNFEVVLLGPIEVLKCMGEGRVWWMKREGSKTKEV